MAKRKKEAIVSDLPFFEYLRLFYVENKKTIKKEYKSLTRKLLDFNDPENSTSYLRVPQFEAFEIYIFLKEFLKNEKLHIIFKAWYNREEKFELRSKTKISGGTLDFFEEIDAQAYERVFNEMSAHQQDYFNYIFALTMGTGKTRLMAMCIFYEFILANKYPSDPLYAHNALIFAPDKTVLQSVKKDIIDLDKSLVIPPEYVNFLDINIKFFILDDSGITLNTIDNSRFNIIISNTQKIILKQQHTASTPAMQLFDKTESYIRAKSINEEFSDLYQFDEFDEKVLLSNQRFSKLTRLDQLGIYVDEAHHAFGNKLENSLTALRLTIDELAGHLNARGTHIIGCFNFTGTPYVNNKLMPEVVYHYSLKSAIENKYLKRADVHGYANARTKDFVRIVIKDFWKKHKNKKYEGMRPKIAFFASTIDELQKELQPAVEKVLEEEGISIKKILVNVGDDSITSNDDLREFINLDSPESKKQFILLVNKGKEGWNCRSLFGVSLFRKPKSKIFVLQASMRCLRQITDLQQVGEIYLSDENKSILKAELEENFKLSFDEFTQSSDDRTTYNISLVPPPRKFKFNRVHKLNNLIEKQPDNPIAFNLDQVDISRYQLTETRNSITDLDSSSSKIDLTTQKEKNEYTELTLVAELACYLNKSPILINKTLTESEEGLEKIIETVNVFNEMIYDCLIPMLFNYFYELQEYERKEEVEIELVKSPKDGDTYQIKGKPHLTVSLSDPGITEYKNKSFHLSTYCFDSQPEYHDFLSLLSDGRIKEIYFTGMLTSGQTDFYISYIDPYSHSLRSYYPDFLIKMKDDSYLILEIKGDHMIDDEIVKSKEKSALEMAAASGIKYKMLKSSYSTDNIKREIFELGIVKDEQGVLY